MRQCPGAETVNPASSSQFVSPLSQFKGKLPLFVLPSKPQKTKKETLTLEIEKGDPIPKVFPSLQILDDPLSWNGSFLGDYPKSYIITVKKTRIGTIWMLNINGLIQPVIAKRCSNSFISIVDELKPLFGLLKLGTHRLSINGVPHVIFQVLFTEEDEIVIETSLNHLPRDHALRSDETFCHRVQNIFAFRELLGLKSSYESSIRLRQYGETIVPISAREVSSYLIEGGSRPIISASILERWFTDRTLSDAI